MSKFDPFMLTEDDFALAVSYLGHGWSRIENPDVTLSPDGTPYLHRWQIAGSNASGNVFLHIQVQSDPERPLHDHPWDNTSVILSGGYDEVYEVYNAYEMHSAAWKMQPPTRCYRSFGKGDMVFRRATLAHRLVLLPATPYTMSLFTTGPKIRDWGFWYPDGWHHNNRHVNDRDPRGSVHVQ